MPDNLMKRLIDAKHATIGHCHKWLVSRALPDLRIHMCRSLEDVPETPKDLCSVTNIDFSRCHAFPNDTACLASFGHLFDWGHDAGCHGCAWSDATAADLASRFRNSTDGFLDRQLGALF